MKLRIAAVQKTQNGSDWQVVTDIQFKNSAITRNCLANRNTAPDKRSVRSGTNESNSRSETRRRPKKGSTNNSIGSQSVLGPHIPGPKAAVQLRNG